jgi:hypothetical protein
MAARAVACGLAAAMLCPPLSGLLPAAHAQSPVPDPNSPTVIGPALPPPLPVELPEMGQSSLLLFPFVNNTQQPSGDAIASQVADALRFRLDSVGAFKVTTYSKFLAPVQRAVQDGVLADADTAGPYADATTAGKIAMEVDTNVYLIGAVESFKADPATRKVTLEVSANLRNTQTNNSIRTLAFTGAAAPVSNADTLDAVTQRAIGTVASKLAAAINGNRKPMVMPASQRGSHKGEQAFLLTILGGALIYAVLHNSNGTNSSRSGTSTITGTTGTGTTTTTTSGPPSPPTGF